MQCSLQRTQRSALGLPSKQRDPELQTVYEQVNKWAVRGGISNLSYPRERGGDGGERVQRAGLDSFICMKVPLYER